MAGSSETSVIRSLNQIRLLEADRQRREEAADSLAQQAAALQAERQAALEALHQLDRFRSPADYPRDDEKTPTVEVSGLWAEVMNDLPPRSFVPWQTPLPPAGMSAIAARGARRFSALSVICMVGGLLGGAGWGYRELRGWHESALRLKDNEVLAAVLARDEAGGQRDRARAERDQARAETRNVEQMWTERLALLELALGPPPEMAGAQSASDEDSASGEDGGTTGGHRRHHHRHHRHHRTPPLADDPSADSHKSAGGETASDGGDRETPRYHPPRRREIGDDPLGGLK